MKEINIIEERFLYYLIFINIISFFFALIDKKFNKKTKIFAYLTRLSCFLGGSLGLFLFIILFDRKSNKGNMMNRVFALSIFVIQVVILIFMKNYKLEDIDFRVWNINPSKILIYYFIIINLFTFFTFGLDKYFAIKNKNRIRIVFLIFLAIIGGSVGGLLSMFIFNHKTRVDYFIYGLPLIILMQVFLLLLFSNISL
ncbi:DUF1294 domain-containing protein [Peptoniphilus obesi]|uniref:DUF1294 domain-containing protein n=1 Tax=Peptoniphilus obesi TaxID=1472765 RepID=UPI0004AE5200|nr:DUF1294 domain-containing protein [Peptoniphilus obesi]